MYIMRLYIVDDLSIHNYLKYPFPDGPHSPKMHKCAMNVCLVDDFAGGKEKECLHFPPIDAA